MALAARELNIVAGEDHAVAVEKKVIVDRELGIAAEVENIAVAVDLGNGKVGVVSRQRIIGVQTQVSNSSNNAAVIRYQPQASEPHTVEVELGSTEYHSNYGKVANQIASGLTYVFISLLCIWAIPFSAVAWGFACCANATYNDDKHICAGILKACSLLWSLIALLIGIGAPVLVALGVIYRSQITNYLRNI